MLCSLVSIAVLAVPGYTLHEWGTFTSVAGEDGQPIEWRPLAEKSDLPSFVYTPGTFTDRSSGPSKRDLRGTIRMETPVIYFYAEEPQEVSLSVRFEGGQLTEWYPWARSFTGTGLDWGRFKLLPGTKPTLKTEPAKSHYYPAREVDAATVQVCSSSGEKEVQQERFLFYRGVGSFAPPLRATLRAGELMLSSGTGRVIIFQRSGSRIGLVEARLAPNGVTVKTPFQPSKRPVDVSLELAQAKVLELLTGAGLYEKEAKAMLETWKDTWFEDGLRVISIVPREVTDRLLPLTTDPAPRESVRVLVGRFELLEAGQVAEARKRLLETRSMASLGRFAEPLARRALVGATPRERAVIEPLLSAWGTGTVAVH